MPVTTIDPTTALVVIDLQKGVVAMPTVHPVENIVRRSASLAEAFRRHRLPVVLVTVGGAPAGRTERGRSLGRPAADWAELVPELGRQPDDITVIKTSRGAFTTTELDTILRDLGVTQIVITGIATGSGIESTARHAHELGYNVTLATDAMTDTNADVHLNSVTRIFPGLGETGTTDEILALLESSRA